MPFENEKYIVQEIQTDVQGNVSLLPPVVKDTRNEAESEYYIKLGYAAISEVPLHSVIMYTYSGAPIMYNGYNHYVEPDTDTDI